MQFGGQVKPPLGVVYDADLGNAIDGVLALAMLYGFQGKSESRVISVSVTKPSLNAAVFADMLVRFYTGEPTQFFGPQPIGLALKGAHPEDTPIIQAVLERKTPEGKPAYGHAIAKINDTADPVAVIRNALSAQYDQNAVILLAGPATNLAALLDLPEGKDLIARKARYLVVSMGAFAQAASSPAAAADPDAARRVFVDWPTPIVAAGAEIGEALPFPAATLDTNFAWAPLHPVVDAYKGAKAMPYDAPSEAMAAALYAVRPQENYFRLSEPGTISVSEDGRTRFTAASSGKHRHLILDPAQKERILQAYAELASGKPVPRRAFRPGAKKQ